MTIRRLYVVFLNCFFLTLWIGCGPQSITRDWVSISSVAEISADERVSSSRNASSYISSSSSVIRSSMESSVVESTGVLSSSLAEPVTNSSSSEWVSSEVIAPSSSAQVSSSSVPSSSSEATLSAMLSSSSKNYIGKYKTDFVIIGVVDGVRWSEGWGEPTQQFMPRMRDVMAVEGVINTQYRNGGQTATVPSHSTMITGVYEGLDNYGKDVPSHASIMHYYLKKHGKHNTKTMVLSPKDKLEVLTKTDQEGWDDQFTPYQYTGRYGEGLGSGYWRDEDFFDPALEAIHTYHPEIVLMNLYRPDKTGHGEKYTFTNYQDAITLDDELYYQLWQYIQSDSIYKDRTTLFITNDHGRHLDGVEDGWRGHGHENCDKGVICDIEYKNCDGCDHIFLYAFGPDFKKGVTVTTPRTHINLAPTVEALLEFDSPHSTGEVMVELFLDSLGAIQ